VEVSVESDKLSGKILCGLIQNLPHGVDYLIGMTCKRMTLHVSLVTRARTYTDRNAVVTPNTDTNDSQTPLHYHPMTNADVSDVHDIVLNARVSNDSDPINALIDHNDDDV